MDYEKKYNEAFKRAKELHEAGNALTKQQMEIVFPQLRESEDERIRKEMVKYFEDTLVSQQGVTTSVQVKSWLAWLEKQKETHYTKRNALFDKCVENCDPETMKKVSDEIDAQLQKEQKPVEHKAFEEWAEDYWSHNKVNNPYSYNKGDEIQFDHKGFVSFCEAYCYPQNLVLHDTFGYEEGRQTGRNEGVKLVLNNPEKYGLQKEQKPVEYGDDIVEEAEEYTSRVDCGMYGFAVTEAYIAGALRERKKQKEQKPFNVCEQCPYYKDCPDYNKQKPAEWDEYTKTNLDRALQIIKKAKGTLQGYQSDDGIYECDKAIECLEHFLYRGFEIERPAEWSEDWREEDIRTRFAFYTYKNEEDDGVLYLSNVFVEEASRNQGFGTKILAAAEKVAETIGATTICLKVKQDSPANAWYRKNGYGYVAFEDGYDWLEKNLEYMKPSKREWSEEDKNKLNHILEIVHIASGREASIDEKEELESFLKSIRPQPKQKWNEEDERMLNELCEELQDLKQGNYRCYTKDVYDEWITWLKSLPERFHLQPEQEWSEDDDQLIGFIFDLLNDLVWRKDWAMSKEECLERLKSLRPQPKVLTLLDENIIEAAVAFVEQNDHFNFWRGIDKHTVIKALHSLKPRWKPSEEQMEALSWAINYLTDIEQECASTLALLKFNLKELM